MWLANWLLKAVKSRSAKSPCGELTEQKGESSTCRAGQTSRAGYAALFINWTQRVHSLRRSSTVSCPRLCNTSRVFLLVCLSSFICDSLLRSHQPVGLCCSSHFLTLPARSWKSSNSHGAILIMLTPPPFPGPLPPPCLPPSVPSPQGTATHPDLSFPASPSSNLQGVFSQFESASSLSPFL